MAINNISIIKNLTHCSLLFNYSKLDLSSLFDFSLTPSPNYYIVLVADEHYYFEKTNLNLKITGTELTNGYGVYEFQETASGASYFTNQARFIRIQMQQTNDGTNSYILIGINRTQFKFTSLESLELTCTPSGYESSNDEIITNNLVNAFYAGGINFNINKSQQIIMYSETNINNQNDWLTPPTLHYDNSTRSTSYVNILCGDDNYTVAGSASLSTDIMASYPSITLTGQGVSGSSSVIAITNNLVNASCNNLSFDKTSQSNSYTITPSNYYEFETPPTLNITDGQQTYTLNFTKSGNVYVLNVDATVYNDVTAVSVNGTAITHALTITTTNLRNATLLNNMFDTTTTNTITVTPTTNYSFVKNCNDPKITISYGNSQTANILFELVNGVYTATIDATQYNNITAVSASGKSYPNDEIYDIDITQLEHIHFTADSCQKIIYQENVYIEVAIDSGYILDGVIKLALYSSGAGYQQLVYDAQKDVYSCTEMDFNHQGRYLIGRAVADSPLISNYGAIRAYKPTNAQIRQLVDKRFYNVNTNEYEDLANYIISFVRYPFNVSTSNSSNVLFGFFDTQISVDLAEQQIYKLSLGKYLVAGLYGNSSDIDKCNIKILLPYADIYTLDSKYINTYIECIYNVDILANTCVIEIYSNDKLIDTLSTSIGYDIPYILKTDRVTPVNINLQSNILKERLPKIEVRQRAKVANTYYKTLKRQTLSGVSGYYKCENILLTVSDKMTLAEQNEIKNLLSAGVIA